MHEVLVREMSQRKREIGVGCDEVPVHTSPASLLSPVSWWYEQTHEPTMSCSFFFSLSLSVCVCGLCVH